MARTEPEAPPQSSSRSLRPYCHTRYTSYEYQIIAIIEHRVLLTLGIIWDWEGPTLGNFSSVSFRIYREKLLNMRVFQTKLYYEGYCIEIGSIGGVYCLLS